MSLDSEERATLLKHVNEAMKKQNIVGFALVVFCGEEQPLLWVSCTTDQMVGSAEVLLAAASEHEPDSCSECTAAGHASRQVLPLLEAAVERERAKLAGGASCH